MIYNKISISIDKLFNIRKSKSSINVNANSIEIKNKKISEENDIIKKLVRFSVFYSDDGINSEKNNIIDVINEAEVIANNSKNPKLFYWLAITIRNFTSWNIRGDERKKYLEKVIYYFDKSFEYSKNVLPIKLPPEKRCDLDFLDQINIAGEAGNILVNEAIVRNLDRGEVLLKFVFDNTLDYEPSLCTYANLFYKKREYKKCVEISLKIKERIAKSDEWKNNPPPAILGIIGTAYRALARQAKKEGKAYEAIEWLQNINNLKIASDNDLKLLEKLKNQSKF